MTIAKFSIIKAGIFVMMILAISFIVLSHSFHHSLGAAIWQITLSQDIWIHGRIIGIFVSPILIVMALNIVRRLVFSGKSGVWIANGELRFLNFYWNALFSRVPLARIDHFSIPPTKPFRSAAVAVHLKNGGVKYLPTLLLSESVGVVQERLMAAMFQEG